MSTHRTFNGITKRVRWSGSDRCGGKPPMCSRLAPFSFLLEDLESNFKDIRHVIAKVEGKA